MVVGFVATDLILSVPASELIVSRDLAIWPDTNIIRTRLDGLLALEYRTTEVVHRFATIIIVNQHAKLRDTIAVGFGDPEIEYWQPTKDDCPRQHRHYFGFSVQPL